MGPQQRRSKMAKGGRMKPKMGGRKKPMMGGMKKKKTKKGGRRK